MTNEAVFVGSLNAQVRMAEVTGSLAVLLTTISYPKSVFCVPSHDSRNWQQSGRLNTTTLPTAYGRPRSTSHHSSGPAFVWQPFGHAVPAELTCHVRIWPRNNDE